jgi:hypothetical protein
MSTPLHKKMDGNGSEFVSRRVTWPTNPDNSLATVRVLDD